MTDLNHAHSTKTC